MYEKDSHSRKTFIDSNNNIWRVGKNPSWNVRGAGEKKARHKKLGGERMSVNGGITIAWSVLVAMLLAQDTTDGSGRLMKGRFGLFIWAQLQLRRDLQ